jgi:hypothetical protein
MLTQYIVVALERNVLGITDPNRERWSSVNFYSMESSVTYPEIWICDTAVSIAKIM